jgi:hypothetical protein
MVTTSFVTWENKHMAHVKFVLSSSFNEWIYVFMCVCIWVLKFCFLTNLVNDVRAWIVGYLIMDIVCVHLERLLSQENQSVRSSPKQVLKWRYVRWALTSDGYRVVEDRGTRRP